MRLKILRGSDGIPRLATESGELIENTMVSFNHFLPAGTVTVVLNIKDIVVEKVDTIVDADECPVRVLPQP